MARKGNPGRVEDADVEVGASVKAKRLRFREKPKTQVELHGDLHEPEGDGELETASGGERQNLPEEVEPGVAYRDVRVSWRAAARLGEPASRKTPENKSEESRSEKQSER